MAITEKLQQRLRQWREAGMTNQEIGDRAGISHAHANRLLNGSSDTIGSLKFATVLLLFPDLQRLVGDYLDGKAVPLASARDDSVAEVVGTGRAEADHNSRATVTNADGRLDIALDAILEDAKMCDACKMAAIRHIRDVAKRA